VREKIHNRLETPSEAGATEAKEKDKLIRGSLLTKIFSDGIFREGTSTRIKDHRIALITAEQIEICDSTCTGEVEFMGIIGVRFKPLCRTRHCQYCEPRYSATQV
jgi:hypothetical protein